MSAKKHAHAKRRRALPKQRPARARKALPWHERILAGLKFEAVERIKARASLTDRELARLLGIAEAALRRARTAGGTLDTATSDRLYRLAKTIAVAEEVLAGTANAIKWLRRAQPSLGGQVPFELLVTQAGAEDVETLLRRIDYGIEDSRR